MTAQEKAFQLFYSLPKDLQQEVVDFMEFLQTKRTKTSSSTIPKRKAGLRKDLIQYMADDFDAPLDDMKDYM